MLMQFSRGNNGPQRMDYSCHTMGVWYMGDLGASKVGRIVEYLVAALSRQWYKRNHAGICSTPFYSSTP